MAHRRTLKDGNCLASSCDRWSRLNGMAATNIMRFTYGIPSWKTDGLLSE